jgi:hypothetical protein
MARNVVRVKPLPRLLAAVGLAVVAAGCSQVQSGGAPTVPTPVGPNGPYFTLVFCGGTTKVGVPNVCGVTIDNAHYGNPSVQVWADLSALGAPYTDHWTLSPCGVCGQTYEADFKARMPGEFQLLFYVKDGDGRIGTAKSTLIVTP